MSSSGKYTPLNINSLGSLLQGTGLTINKETATYMGVSNNLATYTPGSTVDNTVLNPLYQTIRDAFIHLGSRVDSGTYSNLINIGTSSITALGNGKPSTYTRTAALNPYPSAVPYTGEYSSYGWLRLLPLQARYEFYINNGSYSDFLTTFCITAGFKDISNKLIDALNASPTYLDGVYSNMNDLISADITGVSLSTFFWGQDLIASGRAIDLSTISKFGNPENLLVTLQKNKALTKAVNLALLASGLSASDIINIASGVKPTVAQQKNIYGAFSVILKTDLADVLLPLNCQTKNLDSLADLLNPKKLFPNSYKTLSVPKYNANPGPTNSKTYYLIYNGTDVDAQKLKDFGSRLIGIVPNNIAIACDAFSIAMMQIKNIQSVNIEKFSQAVTNLENVSTLGVNGTNTPINQSLANSTRELVAKGSGEHDRYTMCDFFGAMSGVSYDWKTLEGYINKLATPRLSNLYYNLYLAVTWEQATVSPVYSTFELLKDPNNPSLGKDKYYLVTGLTITNPGGGYGREGAPAPTIRIINSGGVTAGGVSKEGSGSSTINLTIQKVLTTYGKVATVYVANRDGPLGRGYAGTNIPTATIDPPPGPGWPSMNGVVQNYINQINQEIRNIEAANPEIAKKAIALYNLFGTRLTKEQNARTTALPTLPELTTTLLNTYSFMESITQFSLQTEQYGAAQVIEAICDLSTIGANSIIGSMREERNALRLGLAGIELDNTVEIVKLPANLTKTSTGNTTASTVTLNVSAPPVVTTTGQTGNTNPNTTGTTNPGTIISTSVQVITGTSTTPGTFGGSTHTTLIPTNVDIITTSTTLLPSVLMPEQAIKDVTDCNCDCWDM